MKAAMLAVVILTVAGVAFHFASSRSATASAGSGPAGLASAESRPSVPGVELVSTSAGHPAAHPGSTRSLSFPLFFEPNVGQTDGRVKFLAHGSGYGLFLTADEAVLSLQHQVAKGQPARSSVIRMHLDGASSTARIQGAEPLPGKSNYFIGNDSSKWRRGISQFARVEYERIYPGVDLVYYGNQKQLEYDFRVAPGADPNQIALSFRGASARLDSGDLLLTTADGNIRFKAPHIYQPASYQPTHAPGSKAEADSSKPTNSAVAGGFRLIAHDKVGFTVGHYDHSRELVIDPLLSYSTYLGMGGEVCPLPPSATPGQGCPQIAIDSADNIYAAGSTTSANFPTTAGAIQPTLNGAQNIFIAVLSPSAGSGSAQLLFATYLGGSLMDYLGGVAVDPVNPSFPNINIYVAGYTSSPDFPTTSNAFQQASAVTWSAGQTHGFLSTINASNASGSNVFTLKYSTILAGNTSSGSTTENDVVTGLAVDSFFDAYVTGTTTSSDILTGFPSTPNGYQICPWQVAQSGGIPCPVTSGPKQFFASEINTAGSGPQSMLYSTYFGGGYQVGPDATGGGIAVDVPSNNPRSSVNMYFTGTTSMPGVPGPNNEAAFPLINAWQSCLNQSGVTQATGCGSAGTNTDAILVKLNPNQNGAVPSYSTYLGGAGNDNGNAVAADSSGNAYVTGSTTSNDWSCASTNACAFAPGYGAYVGGGDAFIAKVANYQGGIFPLVFFAYIGGTSLDSGNAIAVDSVQTAHIAGTTASTDLVPQDPYQLHYGGGTSDAFVALMSSEVLSGDTGNYVTYLGGNSVDQGTGIAIDNTGTAYVSGVTQSSNFPTSADSYQSGLIGAQDAFVTELGSDSSLALSISSGSPSPNPLPAGTQGTFTFDITNNGPDPASNVTFQVSVPQSGVQTIPSAEVVSNGAGSCTSGLTGTIVCQVGSLAVGAKAQVAVFVTPSIPRVDPNETIGVTNAQAFANEGQASPKLSQSVKVTDFSLSAVVTNQGAQVIAGQLAVIDITLTPDQNLGYNANVTLTPSTSPSIVTNPSPTFTINPVILTGTSAQGTVLNIQTVPRPVNSGSLFRHRAFYAAWLPIGGLSLVGLGMGAGRKRRRWFIGILLGLLAGLMLLQPACSSGSSAAQSGGGTQAGNYFITITASAGTGATHQTIVELTVN